MDVSIETSVFLLSQKRKRFSSPKWRTSQFCEGSSSDFLKLVVNYLSFTHQLADSPLMSLDCPLCQTKQNKHTQSQHNNSGLFKSSGRMWRAGDGGGVQRECGAVGMGGKWFGLNMLTEFGISLYLWPVGLT